MTRTLGLIAVMGASLLVGSCAVGVDPPAPTQLVEITTGLEFTFGNATWCIHPGMKGAEEPSCTGSNPFEVVWPQIQVELKPFAIDAHEVTNYQYEYCVAAGGCSEPRFGNALSDDQKSYYADERFRDYPVVAISWEQANDYCAFLGRRLPTEFEWERVAKGANSDRLFPAEALADDIEDCKTLGFNTVWCRGDSRMDAVTDTDVDFVTEGGAKIYHLFGNASEWTSTGYDEDVQCKGDPLCDREEDCTTDACKQEAHSCTACPPPSSDACYYMCDGAGEETRTTIVCAPYPAADQPLSGDDLEESTSGAKRVIRGGSVALSADSATCQYRSSSRDFNLAPDAVEPTLGFRCAKTL